MGWETRSRGGRYYTRSHKVDGRVVREYVSSGLLGELAARSDVADRDNRQERTQVLRREQAQWAVVEGPLADLDELAGILTEGMLLLAGYHRHHRSEWRRRRESD